MPYHSWYVELTFEQEKEFHRLHAAFQKFSFDSTPTDKRICFVLEDSHGPLTPMSNPGMLVFTSARPRQRSYSDTMLQAPAYDSHRPSEIPKDDDNDELPSPTAKAACFEKCIRSSAGSEDGKLKQVEVYRSGSGLVKFMLVPKGERDKSV